jgi:hypothetical protein
MYTHLIALTALLVTATALSLLIAYMAATSARLDQLEAPIPTYTGPAERRA